ncbi:uncharacterized protein PADG_07390 [Paracoccidioides brasiliensis Pb18]|uniref:Major facilitator superfamily (MFS) profile domain-containing protein n=1 Tax=Paracoccidioides brasiliensis (strain Pb18) TaxID=502780 RepID=C1GJF4_PARBD|nr:uncharacterized protein PADG_07390 [Paracoccidioides brasiliensis Pb18]EEH42570.1 hypothetical protein PADG_07390 [Paracoccidioides brasiliensis Pb18]
MNPLATKSTPSTPVAPHPQGRSSTRFCACPGTPSVQAPQRRTKNNRDASVIEKLGAGEATAAGKPEQNNQEAGNEEIDDNDPRHLGIYRLSLVLISLNLSVFLIGLDNTIISTAIPKITDNFHALGDVGWYASSYLLTTCAFQLMWGDLYTLYSIKWTYIAALFVVQFAGVGSGGVTNGAFLLVAHLVLPRQRPTLVGMIGGMYGFASIAGPLMGGKKDLPDRPTKADGSPWETAYEWKNRRIIVLLAIVAALLVGFVIIQVISGDRATVPPRVFCNRNIWGSTLFGSGVTACFFTMLYHIPIWFQAIKGVSAVKSGVMTLPMILSFVIFSFVGGTLNLPDWLLYSGHPEWIGYQFILGAGIGLGLQAAFVSTQTALPLEDIPIGTATIMFSENLAAVIMVSVAQNVFANQLMRNLGTHVPGFDGHRILTIGATQIKNKVPPELYDAVLIAYNRSFGADVLRRGWVVVHRFMGRRLAGMSLC